MDGFVYMSEQVHGELKAYSDAPALFSPHPLFENFGERVARNEACVRLGLDPTVDYVLFFGLIRDYKGLDLLLDAWAGLRRRGLAAGRRLIVAGEFYTPKERYLRQIADNGPLTEDIEKTREFLLKNWQNTLEQNGSWMGYLQSKYGSGLDFVREYKSAVEALTNADVQAMARKVLEDGNLVKVIMRPAPAEEK